MNLLAATNQRHSALYPRPSFQQAGREGERESDSVSLNYDNNNNNNWG